MIATTPDMLLSTGLTERERETDRLTIGDYTELVTHALNNVALSTLQKGLYRKKEKEERTALTRFKFSVALRPQRP